MNLEKYVFKIEEYLKNNFNIIFDLDLDIYFLGGAVKDIMLDVSPKDLDFVVLNSSNEKIDEFVTKNNLNYIKNSFNGYKIKYNGFEIDLWNTKDLYKCIQYDFDGLFYNIKSKSFLTFGFINSLENGKLTEINSVMKNKRTCGEDIDKDNKRKAKSKERLDMLKKLI